MNERRRICEAAGRIIDEGRGTFAFPGIETMCLVLKAFVNAIPSESFSPESARALFAIGNACEKLAIAIELPLDPLNKNVSLELETLRGTIHTLCEERDKALRMSHELLKQVRELTERLERSVPGRFPEEKKR